MNVGAVGAVGTAQTQQAGRGGKNGNAIQNLNKEIQSLKEEVKKRRIDIRKLSKDKTLSDAQREAKQKLLESEIENYQQQITQKQQRIQELREEQSNKKSSESSQKSEPEKTPEETRHVDTKTVHGLISSSTSLDTVEQLNSVKNGLARAAKTLARTIESDDATFGKWGGALQVNRDELESLNSKVRKMEMDISGRLGDLLEESKETEDESLEAKDPGKAEDASGNRHKEAQKEEEPQKIDTYA